MSRRIPAAIAIVGFVMMACACGGAGNDAKPKPDEAAVPKAAGLGTKKLSATDLGSHYVEVEEDRTYEGVVPEKTFLTIFAVYQNPPREDVIYGHLLDEIKKHQDRGVDITAAARKGNKDARPSWVAVKDRGGDAVFVKYDAAKKIAERTTYSHDGKGNFSVKASKTFKLDP